MAAPSKPVLLIDPPETGTGAHPYFDRLSARPDCHRAFSLRSQAEINSFPEAAQSSLRQPIVYDPEMDAAVLRFFPRVSFDIKGRYVPIEATGTFLLSWDFRFDPSFRWLGPGYVNRHKAWRLDPFWIALRTDYRHAANVGQFGEVFFTLPGARFAVAGQSWRQKDDPDNPKNLKGWLGEMLQPRVGEFFFEPDTWTRIWIAVDSYDQDPSLLSAWVADERREAVQLYDRLPLHPNDSRTIKDLFIEYDTSGDQNPASPILEAQQSWNRNVVVLKDLSVPEAVSLLERP